MDLQHDRVRVVLEPIPIILADLVIQEGIGNGRNIPPGSDFVENFRRNQVHSRRSSNGSVANRDAANEGALVLIRTNGLTRRNFLLPAIIPPQIRNRVIPLPEFPPERHNGSTSDATVIEDVVIIDKEKMGPFKGIWSCECPVPGSQPLVSCGECRRRECFEWSWSKGDSDSTAVFQNSDRDVMFNPGFSVGTVAIRGSSPLRQGYHHYWEIEMSTEVYGTDMMIGVGTDKTDLRKYSHNFVSFIGCDKESWGLSYTGAKHHNQTMQPYTKAFGQHTVVGVHLDLWSGRLEFYINRKPIGLAFDGLKDKVLYPMISSTAARSGMNLIFCRSYPPTLQLQTMLSLGKYMSLPDNVSLFKVLPGNVVPPGLKLLMKNNFWWITSKSNRDAVEAGKLDQLTKEKKTETAKGKVHKQPSLHITDAFRTPGRVTEAPGSSTSQTTIRRGRKTKKDDSNDHEHSQAKIPAEGITTRSMTARRTFLVGSSPIFAPPPESPTPVNLLKASECRRPMTRSSSSPSVRDARHFVEEDQKNVVEQEGDLPLRPASSNSNEPGSKRMCLRSSKR